MHLCVHERHVIRVARVMNHLFLRSDTFRMTDLDDVPRYLSFASRKSDDILKAMRGKQFDPAGIVHFAQNTDVWAGILANIQSDLGVVEYLSILETRLDYSGGLGHRLT